MLVLSRKKNESIIINDNITITVIEIRGDEDDPADANRPQRSYPPYGIGPREFASPRE